MHAPTLRVAYLINCYPSPSHTFIKREIRALEAAGVEVVRYSVRAWPAPLVDATDREELARTRLVLGEGLARLAAAALWAALTRPRAFAGALRLAVRLGRRSDRGLLRHLVYLAEACLLLPWVRAAAVEHLHAHFGTNPAAVAALLHALGGPRFSFTVHGPEEFDKPEFLGLGLKIEHAAFVVAISSFGRSQLFRWARPEDWPKVEVIRCGVEASLLRGPVAPVPAAARLVCVARLSEQKGHLVLVEAAARLAAEGVPFRLVLAGDGPMRGLIEARIAALGLQDHFELAGWMDAAQVRAAIEGARALVLPSFAEGLPVVVMEALALGRPVVTTAIAGIPELVESGLTGWLVPAGSVEALVGAMRAVLKASPERLSEMGRSGAGLVARSHDSAEEARRLALLFRTPPHA